MFDPKTVKYRQGDVLIIAISEIPTTATAMPRQKAYGVVLAEGEATGHRHRIPSRHATMYRSESDARYLRVMGPAPVALRHEEHTTVKIPPGSYQVIIHHEYQPGAVPRRVED